MSVIIEPTEYAVWCDQCDWATFTDSHGAAIGLSAQHSQVHPE